MTLTRAYDVVVIGGGVAGVAAALSSAREGASTLLVERNAFLGGAATAGSVGQFVGWETSAARRVIAGVAADIVAALQETGGASSHGHFTMSTGHRMDRVEYDPEILKIVLDQLLTAAPVDVLFQAAIHNVSRSGRRIEAVVLDTPATLVEATGHSFIDASGDLAVLSKAGAVFLPPDGNENVQPATLMFALGPIDFEALDNLDRETRDRIIAKGLASGALPRASVHRSRVPGSDSAWFNITRVEIDPDDAFALSAAQMEGRRQALAAARFLIAEMPGCENARLSRLAPQLGVRDFRRVKGDHVLTRAELAAGTVFEDTVACGAYPIDIHHPAGEGGLTFEEFGEDHYYAIPLRALVPVGFSNVLTAGRGVSATHEAFAALRVMPTAMAMGQAAGTAAALAANGAAGDVRSVPMATLRQRLVEAGAFLGA